MSHGAAVERQITMQQFIYIYSYSSFLNIYFVFIIFWGFYDVIAFVNFLRLYTIYNMYMCIFICAYVQFIASEHMSQYILLRSTYSSATYSPLFCFCFFFFFYGFMTILSRLAARNMRQSSRIHQLI